MATVSVTLIEPKNDIPTLTPTLRFGFTHDIPGGVIFGPGADWEVRRVSDDAVFWLHTTSPLAGVSQVAYGGSPLVDNVPYKWRCNVKFTGDTPAESGWTEFQVFTPRINDPPTGSVTTPMGVVSSLTPAITINFTDPDSTGDAAKFAAYQIQVRRKSDSTSFWDPGQTATNSGQQSARQAVVTYAGTALVSGTTYQVRARVQDGGGLWSEYTAWQDFTPTVGPDAPADVAPSGLQNTLTPTVSGAYQQGLGDTEAAFQYEIRQGTITIYQSGDVATAIATGQAYGTNNSGDTPSSPPALQWGTAYSVRMRSKDSNGAYGPWSGYVSFHTNAAPTTPTNLSPNNNAVTGDTTPTLSWVHNDPDGDAQTKAKIELYDLLADAYVSGYDPKELTQATLTHTVTETLDDNPTNHRWRVATMGLAGPGYGPWSDWAPFTVAEVPVVEMTEPDVGEVIATPSFLVTWNFSGGSGTQGSYRVRVYADDGATVLYDSEEQASTDVEHLVPAGTLRNGNSYYFRLTVKDSLTVEGDTGLVPVTVSLTPPAAVTGLVATAVGGDA